MKERPNSQNHVRYASIFDESTTERRRATGEPTELLKDKESAKIWLVKNASPKYVDAAWLGHAYKISTPKLRLVSKNAWQIMSEELGDGELDKNHVHLYRSLLQDIGVHLPDGYSLDFTQPGLGMDDESAWKSAASQLLISLFRNDFVEADNRDRERSWRLD